MFSKVILAVSVMVFSSMVSAQSLKDLMGNIGEDTKTIILAFKGGELTNETLTAATNLRENVEAAQAVLPEGPLTPEQQIRYQELMGQLKNQSALLEEAIGAALTSNPKDVTKAQEIFNAMMELRKTGHLEFKKQ